MAIREGYPFSDAIVSTLLEILDGATGRELHAPSVQEVSTLLEILVCKRAEGGLCCREVSTLLEILGLMCLVVVGF